MSEKNTEKPAIKIMIAGDGSANVYLEWLKRKYDVTVVNSTDKPVSRDIAFILYTGGEDVHPSFYGEKINSKSVCNEVRDEIEHKFFHRYRNIPSLGICRGGQLLTAFAGGKLIQHVTGHQSSHKIDVRNYGQIMATSSHHQMMYPYNLSKNKYLILGTSTNFMSKTYQGGEDKEMDLANEFLEPEIIYYNNIHALCIQGHPEWDKEDSLFSKATLNMVDHYLIKNRNQCTNEHWEPTQQYEYDYEEENDNWGDDHDDEHYDDEHYDDEGDQPVTAFDEWMQNTDLAFKSSMKEESNAIKEKANAIKEKLNTVNYSPGDTRFTFDGRFVELQEDGFWKEVEKPEQIFNRTNSAVEQKSAVRKRYMGNGIWEEDFDKIESQETPTESSKIKGFDAVNLDEQVKSDKPDDIGVEFTKNATSMNNITQEDIDKWINETENPF